MSQYFYKHNSHKASAASISDIIAPTFLGIDSLTQNANGSLGFTLLAATDSTNPIRYEIYIALSSVGLFSLSNICLITNLLSGNIFTNNLGTLLVAGTYFVGVRAVDAVGNRDNNTVSISAVSLGVPDNSLVLKLDSLLADLALVKTQTDKFSFTGANVNSIAQVVVDKTGYALTVGERNAIASAVEAAILNELDGQAVIDAIVLAIGNSNVDELALVAAIRSDLERVGGKLDLTALEATLLEVKNNTGLIPAIL
jgi:ABC-type thiamin/hydroxymethylpyrimidine transport system permease subunit